MARSNKIVEAYITKISITLPSLVVYFLSNRVFNSEYLLALFALPPNREHKYKITGYKPFYKWCTFYVFELH